MTNDPPKSGAYLEGYADGLSDVVFTLRLHADQGAEGAVSIAGLADALALDLAGAREEAREAIAAEGLAESEVVDLVAELGANARAFASVPA